MPIIDLIEKNTSENVSWIPSHPIAGTEESGPESGFSELFKDRWCILTPSKKANEKDINLLKTFWQKVGSKVDIMEAEQHDYILSITSHIPHLIVCIDLLHYTKINFGQQIHNNVHHLRNSFEDTLKSLKYKLVCNSYLNFFKSINKFCYL